MSARRTRLENRVERLREQLAEAERALKAGEPLVRVELSGRVWRCSGCGREDYWGPTWEWYGAIRDLEDDGRPVFVVCSEACKPAEVPR